MKKISVLVLSLFLIFAFGFQVYAEDMSGGAVTTNVNNRDTTGRGMGTMNDRNNLGNTMDRTNTFNDNQTNMRGRVGGYNTNMGTNAAGDNDNWGWLGILGLLGLAGMFGRNRSPEK